MTRRRCVGLSIGMLALVVAGTPGTASAGGPSASAGGPSASAASHAVKASAPDRRLVASAQYLGTFGGEASAASAIDGSLVGGWAGLADGRKHAFVYDLASSHPHLKDLNIPDGGGEGMVNWVTEISGRYVVGFDAQDGGMYGYPGFFYDVAAPRPRLRILGLANGIVGGHLVAVLYPDDVDGFRYLPGVQDLSTDPPELTLIDTWDDNSSANVQDLDGRFLVGGSEFANRERHAYVSDLRATTPVLSDLGTLGGTRSQALAVDAPLVVGAAATSADHDHAFLFDLSARRPHLVDLGTLGGESSEASAVDSDIVVGAAVTRLGATHAFAYDAGARAPRMVDLGSLGGDSRATDVDGTVVVGTATAPDRSTHAFAYDLAARSSGMVDLGPFDDDSFNRSGPAISGSTVVGTSYDHRGRQRATVWHLRHTASPLFTFGAAAYRTEETTAKVPITVSRVGDLSGTASVAYSATPAAVGGAQPGADFVPVSGRLTFAPGQREAAFRVRVLSDDETEDQESVDLRLSRPEGGPVLGLPSSVRLAIDANDPQPDLAVSETGTENYVGDGVYGSDGADETVTVATQRRVTSSFTVRIEVEPPSNETTVSGPRLAVIRGSGAGRRATVRYLQYGTDVTDAVRSRRGYPVEVWPGGHSEMEVRVRPHRGADLGRTLSALLTATVTSDMTRVDAVRTAVRVAR